MSESPDVINRFKTGLDPYIKPREQANYIRRILALHLSSVCSQDVPLKQPLALVAASNDAFTETQSALAKGLHQDYLDALKNNVAARQHFENVVDQQRSETSDQDGGGVPITSETLSNPLEERLAMLKLEKKRQKLTTIRKYLDQLSDEPAASQSFLEPEQIFDGVTPLPSVPQGVVNGLASEPGASDHDLKTRAASLEKTVLRAKLLLKKEEKLLEEARARSRHRPDVTSHGARLEALNATRTELITWIESELSVTSDQREEDADTSNGGNNSEANQASINKGLAEIKQKYAKYLQSRTELLSLVSSRPSEQPIKPDLKPEAPQAITETSKPPIDHLLIPHVESLLAVSRRQKSLINQRSHFNTSLSKQTKEARQGLGHLAEESQLLPAYPMKESLRRRSGLVDELTSKKSDSPDMAKRIKPWVFAADSAKIANLESVAETIESGQIALEGSMEALSELETLVGIKKPESTEQAAEVPDEDDVWLATEGNTEQGAGLRHTEKQSGPARKPGDVWSALHGNLGLIGQEDAI